MVSTSQIGWLAGLMEGDGTAYVANTRQRNPNGHMAVMMSDLDVVEKVSQLWGVSASVHNHRNRPDRKTIYRAQISGTKAAQWAMTIYSLMGTRRKTQLLQVINAWKAQKHSIVYGRMADCHTDRKHKALGLCHKCYSQRHKEPENAKSS